jgi:CheY-like chemotaxis protein
METHMHAILVATTQKKLEAGVRSALSGKDYSLSVVSPGKPLTDSLHAAQPDLVVLANPGPAQLRLLRTTAPGTPVISIYPRPHARRFSPAPAVADFVIEPLSPAELRARVDRLLQKTTPAPPPAAGEHAVLPSLHDRRTGRLDAKAIADHIDVKLTDLSKAIGKGYKATFKSPSSSALQPLLAPIYSLLLVLHRLYPERADALAWLNAPSPALGKARPIELVLHGRAGTVADLLHGALSGVPT